MTEYRIRWSASSNISFRGASDWEDWIDSTATRDDIERDLTRTIGVGGICDGLEMALEFSGFEWWVETREAEA